MIGKLSAISMRPLGAVTKKCFVMVIAFIMMLMLNFTSTQANAAIDVYEFDTPQQEAQYRALIEEFRCPKCQNQNLAGSDSQISRDLKRKTYQMVMVGQTDAQIREYMYERYGDFISYRPPVRPSTWILWFLPPLVLVLLIGWWLWRNSKSNRTIKNAKKQTSQTKYSANSANTVTSDLTEQEFEKLKALLNQHGKQSDVATDSLMQTKHETKES